MNMPFASLEELVSAFLFLPAPHYKPSPVLDPLSIFALNNSSSATVADYDLLDTSINEITILDMGIQSIDRLQGRLQGAKEMPRVTSYPMTPKAESFMSLLALDKTVCKSAHPTRLQTRKTVVVSQLEADIIEAIAILQGIEGVTRKDPLSIRLDSASMTALSLFQSISYQNLALFHEVIPGLLWHLLDEDKILLAQHAIRDKQYGDLPKVAQIALMLCQTMQQRPPTIQMEGVITLIQTVLNLHPLRAKALQTAVQLYENILLTDMHIVSHLTTNDAYPQRIISTSTFASSTKLDWPTIGVKEAHALSL